MFTKIQTFIGEVMTEMQKVSWTTRKELVDATLIVIFSAVILGCYIAGIDVIFSKGVATLLK